MGYLGGVNFALLVAKVCMWLPGVNAAVLVLTMFMVRVVGWGLGIRRDCGLANRGCYEYSVYLCHGIGLDSICGANYLWWD